MSLTKDPGARVVATGVDHSGLLSLALTSRFFFSVLPNLKKKIPDLFLIKEKHDLKMYRNVVEIGQNIFAACATQQVLLLTVCEELAHLLTMSNTHGCPLSSVFFFLLVP